MREWVLWRKVAVVEERVKVCCATALGMVRLSDCSTHVSPRKFRYSLDYCDAFGKGMGVVRVVLQIGFYCLPATEMVRFQNVCSVCCECGELSGSLPVQILLLS